MHEFYERYNKKSNLNLHTLSLNKHVELDEHWADRQAQNRMASQMHYLSASRASVIQPCTLTYL